ncbi:MAG: PAC2 family protein [Deltaproteobacteria bacterium]|nr:PAC2 family protein [Deltaproteobacteria bacterium]
MNNETIILDHIPEMEDALLIMGFEGWGNALDVSSRMVEYLVRKLKAKPFGRLNPDLFYSYTKNRPRILIENGLLKEIEPPGGVFYKTSEKSSGQDIILIKATEPDLNWYQFTESIIHLCQKIGVKTIITLGSMFDNVSHTDSLISAIASSAHVLESVCDRKIIPINYKGPGAIHTALHTEAGKKGLQSLSLWCHCPYYLQGTTHFGLLSHLGNFLSSWGGFYLDTEELSITWADLSMQIQDIIDNNTELREAIKDLHKTKIKQGTNTSESTKIIRLDPFLRKR